MNVPEAVQPADDLREKSLIIQRAVDRDSAGWTASGTSAISPLESSGMHQIILFAAAIGVYLIPSR